MAAKRRHARCATNDLIRVVFPPLVLIIAVLGSILGGVTNPTPAAALGAGGAIMLAAYRKLQRSGPVGYGDHLVHGFAVIIALLMGVNFDLRINQGNVSVESWIRLYHGIFSVCLYALFGLLFCLLGPVCKRRAERQWCARRPR